MGNEQSLHPTTSVPSSTVTASSVCSSDSHWENKEWNKQYNWLNNTWNTHTHSVRSLLEYATDGEQVNSHRFIAHNQSSFLKTWKKISNLMKPSIVILDFAENYSYVVQDAAIIGWTLKLPFI